MNIYPLNETIILRAPENSDAPQIMEVKNNQEAAGLLEAENKYYSMQDIHGWITFHLQEKRNLMMLIEDRQNNIVIGHVALYNIDIVPGHADFGILIGRTEYWNKGIGTLATKKMIELGHIEKGINSVSLHVLQRNARAIHMYAEIGFKEIGLLPEQVNKNGVMENILVMQYNLNAG